MKNLNPQAGKQQLINGYFCLPRINITALLNQANPTLLGYLIIAISAADWDSDKYRFGFIRYSSRELSAILDLSHSTLQRNFRELKKLGWLELDKEKKVYKVNNYKIYSLRGAQTFTKKISEINKDDKGKIIEGLMSDRKNSQIKQICSSIQAPEDDSFNDCFSDSSNTFSNKLSKKLTDKEIDDVNSSIPF